jgi:ABC-type microcin C transport system duplicated ATPase subunit YejF
MTSLNPVLTIGRQIAEPMEVHRNMRLKEMKPDAFIEIGPGKVLSGW